MSEETQDLREDLDSRDHLEDDADTMQTLDADVFQIEEMEEDLSQLLSAVSAIDQFGLNPTAFSIMKSTGLLAGTSLSALATESLSRDDSDGVEADMAMEALTDKIKEQSAKWAAKILSFVKDMGSRVLGVITKLNDLITERVQRLTQKAWDKTSSARATVKAHPFRTIAAVTAAIAAVAAIAALIASVSPGTYANESALQSFVYRIKDMIGKIKWPFGKLNANVVENGAKVALQIETTAIPTEAATAEALGWSQSAVKAISGQLNRAWTALKTGLSSAGGKVISVAKHINDSGGDMAAEIGEKVKSATRSNLSGWAVSEGIKKLYLVSLWAMVGVLYKLITTIVISGFRMIADTFRNLRPATD